MTRTARLAALLCALVLSCEGGTVRAPEEPDAGDDTKAGYVPDDDFGEPVDPVSDEDLVDLDTLEPIDPAELPDPGPPDEDLAELAEDAYPIESLAPDAGAPACTAGGWRELPEFVRPFEARWPAVRDEALLYARCGDITGNQRLETTLSSLVAMYESTAHPRYAVRFLTLVEALRAAAVRNGDRYVDKDIAETTGPRRVPGAACVPIEGGRFACLAGCGTRPARPRGNGLADMYLAEPVLRGLRDILATDVCYLPAGSPLRARARRYASYFRAVLWLRWRSTARAYTEGQFHIIARYGSAALQVCLLDPDRNPDACALARARGAYLRDRMIANPRVPGALLWGSSTGACDPARPDLACHTIGGACDCDPGERNFDCRGPQARCSSASPTCWRTRCGVTDVSHANTVVGFALDLHRHADRVGPAAAFRDTELRGLATTLRDVIWCGEPLPRGPYASSVFIDGFDGCGRPSPTSVPKRDRQRRALALGWFRLGRWDAALLPAITSHTAHLLDTSPARDRAALAAHAELYRAVSARLFPESSLLGADGCRRCP
jgi:hypothetical protein